MSKLKVVLWKWKDPAWPAAYDAERVNIMADSVSRNLTLEHEICCVTDDSTGLDSRIKTIPMWSTFADLGHCYRRLRAFDADMSAIIGDRFVSMDLDTVITGSLDGLFANFGDFKMAKDTQPPTPYNGSMFGMVAGARRRVFDSFLADPDIWIKKAKELRYCACDQAIIGAVLGASETTWGADDGVYSFKNEVLARGGQLPANAKVVFFHGNPKPWQIADNFAWIKSNYRRSRRQLLVLGGADCVWEDLKAFGPVSCDVMVINDMGCDYPGIIKYWVTLHPEKFDGWRSRRRGNQDYETWAHSVIVRSKAYDVVNKTTKDWGGSSGLFAAKVGLELGYDHITLCGCPMTETPHYFQPNRSWKDCSSFIPGWTKNLDAIKGKVFSMSGWTKEILGYQKFEP